MHEESVFVKYEIGFWWVKRRNRAGQRTVAKCLETTPKMLQRHTIKILNFHRRDGNLDDLGWKAST